MKRPVTFFGNTYIHERYFIIKKQVKALILRIFQITFLEITLNEVVIISNSISKALPELASRK